jgi:hypothetical protein
MTEFQELQDTTVPEPRYRLAVKFGVAVTAALAVLVPSTLSFGITLIDTPIENLTFAAHRQIQSTDTFTLTNTLGTNPLWVKETEQVWEGETRFTSVTGICHADLYQGPLAVATGSGDRISTLKYLERAFSSNDPEELADTPTSTRVAYHSAESGPGRTVEGLELTNGVWTGFFRSIDNTQTVIYVGVTCVDEGAEAAALTSDAFRNIAVLGVLGE